MSLARSDDLNDGNERNHKNHHGEHEPTDTVGPVRVDVFTECNRRVIHQRKHDQKLHNSTVTTVHAIHAIRANKDRKCIARNKNKKVMLLQTDRAMP